MFLLEVGKTFPLQFLDKRSVELKIGLKKKKKKPKKPNTNKQTKNKTKQKNPDPSSLELKFCPYTSKSTFPNDFGSLEDICIAEMKHWEIEKSFTFRKKFFEDILSSEIAKIH